ncbi:MAG: sigma-70 family RNA polymerase sigma factor [Pseudomonadota bacterium]
MKHDPSGFRPTGYANASPYAPTSRAEVERRVRQFLPLVRRAAWHIYGTGREGIEIEDLMQAGILALTECAQKHNGDVEDGFAAYAKLRVRGAMLDQIRKLMNDTRTARKKRAAFERTATNLRGQLGREPSRYEIARTMQISDAELLEIESSAVSVCSISEEYDETNVAFAAEEPGPFDILSGEEDRDQLITAMSQLPDRLKLVLQLFFVEELNLTEIAAVLEVSVPRVHQLRAKALKDLRGLMER